MKNNGLKHILPLIALTILGVLGTKALLRPGFYTSHDGEHQLVRQYIFDRAIQYGQIPPRFDRQLQNHLGYPLFTFTYQLPFWIGETLIKSGYSFPDSIKGTFILTFIASGLAMYLFAQDRWGRFAGLLAGFLYLWAPYRFLTIFVRAQLGEHTALVFIPLLLWAISKTANRKIRTVVGAVSVAGLLLSHSMVAQMAALPFLLFSIARLWREKLRKPFLIQTLSIAILGVGLASFYLIPALNYRSAIQGLNRTFYAEHFVTLKQLLYSKWDYGFSISGEGDGMSFQIGIAQWLTVAVSTWLVARSILRKKINGYLLAFLLAFVISVFLMTGQSSSLWVQAVKKWLVIDIPWRFLAITTFTSAALAAFVIKATKSAIVKLAIFTLLVLVAFYTNRNHLRVNKYIDFDQGWLDDYKGTSNSYDEYKPVLTSQNLLKIENIEPAEVVDGEAEVTIIDDQPHRLTLTADVKTSARIKLNTVFFPGWQLSVDQAKINIETSLSEGAPTVTLTDGIHHLDLSYRQTNLMKLANAISLVSASIILVILSQRKNFI